MPAPSPFWSQAIQSPTPPCVARHCTCAVAFAITSSRAEGPEAVEHGEEGAKASGLGPADLGVGARERGEVDVDRVVAGSDGRLAHGSGSFLRGGRRPGGYSAAQSEPTASRARFAAT